MKDNLLLINPWIHDFAAYDLWIKPLGLLYIASILRNYGYKISFIDCLDRRHPRLLQLQGLNSPREKEDGRGAFYKEIIPKPPLLEEIPRKYGRYGITPEIFEEELNKTPSPSLVLVTSGMTYWYPGVQETIRIVKRHFPRTPVLLGGIYASLHPHHARKFSGADYVLERVEESEVLITADELLGKRRDYSSLPSWGNYPYPAYDLVPRGKFLPLLTSRGCPFRCPFCAVPFLQPHFQRKDPGKVVEEIEYHREYFEVKNYAFYDNSLLLESELHIKPLLREIVKRNLKVSFHTPNGLHPRFIDRELAELLFEAGFKTIRLSLESSRRERQREMEGKVSNLDLKRAISNLERGGYERKKVEVYLLVGLPGQTFQEVLESMELVHSFGAIIKLAFYSPIPRTPYWKRAVEEFFGGKEPDPLLTNNSLLPFRRGNFSPGDIMRIKEVSRRLNRLNSEDSESPQRHRSGGAFCKNIL